MFSGFVAKKIDTEHGDKCSLTGACKGAVKVDKGRQSRT